MAWRSASVICDVERLTISAIKPVAALVLLWPVFR